MDATEKYVLDGKDSKGYAVYPAGGFPCLLCSHILSEEKHNCHAFPNGIPLEIWNGKNDHSKQYPGDNGITYKA
ncbi:hypothetical protein [Pelosinus sp. IPA-1]|uniref:hypothetical protein n=1 Tax=Pelosinus sp. IPA-1 TaxID=3029569 RepID=UPI0024361BD2|nr:hypothetical protein [Pelosinus sp. IPA-1]GMB00914.1 hypothetical protein PIPA1_37130 [Pelosinus sp. IPA-1]